MENASNIGNLFAFSNDPVIVTEDGVIRYMNPSALSLFGWDYMYKPVRFMLPEQIMDVEAEAYVASAVIQEKNMSISCSTIGSCRLYSIVAPTPREDETIIHSVSSAMRELTSGIKTNTDLLKSYSLQLNDETLQKYSAMLNHYTSKLKRLVNNYTLFSDIKEKKQKINAAMYSMNELLREISRELSEVTHPRGIDVQFIEDEDIYTAVDRDLLLQLLMNLISNSLNHMPNGGLITLKVRLKNNYVILYIEDNGTGIPDYVMKDIFKVYSMPMDLGSGTFGTGLGMSVADAIAKLHGGSMIIESRENFGTRVTVKLPRVIDSKFNSPKPQYHIPMRASIFTDLSTWLRWEDYLTEL
ncbi:MAG: PAS domain-containing sensor histidine kinase [Oscillospiraceae bacterium]|nr:PAS domain-containing sensor histidine kinase [Oscillospiraceae bacterium]